jgi:predicted membrane-bound dolichyl-phosphate-mannose-protein mannosyltransferase
VVLDTTVRIYRGGVLGVVGVAILTGYLMLIGHLTNVLPTRIAVSSDTLLMTGFFLIGCVVLFISRSRNRTLRMSWMLIVGVACALAGATYTVLRLAGQSQLLSVVQTDVVGYTAVALSVAVYISVATIERLVMKHTLSSDEHR